MTIRAKLDVQKRRIMGGALLGFLIAIIGLAFANLNMTQLPPHLAVLPGGVLMVLVLTYGWLFGLRCPRCDGPWNALAMDCSKSFFQIHRSIRYCPFCGRDIDAEPAAENRVS